MTRIGEDKDLEDIIELQTDNRNGGNRMIPEEKKYILLALDPVHVGTGGNTLGRVDLPIVREPGTRLPKIPGTSLNGAIRQYAAYYYNKKDCAGQKNHCTHADCPICYTFGTANESGGGNKGVVSFGDARLLLFPVYSMSGPVWVTSPELLGALGIELSVSVSGSTALFTGGLSGNANLNLGWLMVEKQDIPEGENVDIALPNAVPQVVQDRIVVVSDCILSQVVNANLEVRTSVSIDPETGAAEQRALFTHESLPRSTFLLMSIVVDDYRNSFEPKTEKYRANNDEEAELLDLPWNNPVDVVKAGMSWTEMLGVGGMGTRGFGKVRITEVR